MRFICDMVLFFFFFFLLLLSQFHVSSAASTETTLNPFTANASLVRYWNTHVTNTLPKPAVLFAKSSPISAVDSAVLARRAARGTLSSHFQSFCSLANLFCSFDHPQANNELPRVRDADFSLYGNKNFANYGSSRLRGSDSFKNYSGGLNSAADSFKRYSGNSSKHQEEFKNYAEDSNVATSGFTSYAAGAHGGSGEFENYERLVNVPNLRFTAYDLEAKVHKLSFSGYGNETNSGSEAFVSYGKNGNGDPNEFNSYAQDSNIITSTFTGYGESGKKANDSFRSYGVSSNNPHTNFKSYGNGGNSQIDSFSNYRNGANSGDDSFQSYAKNSNAGNVSFANYGRSFNHGNDSFKEYGGGSAGQTTIGFKTYSVDRSFTAYRRTGVSFSEYRNFTTGTGAGNSSGDSGKSVKRWVEPGKFFRESELKQGNVMVMPDIRDRMPPRSFLPRPILVNLPFSSSKISELREIFHAQEESAMERVILTALAECERAPSPGETKRCVGSAEDMIDFATSVLGRNVVVRTTENVSGSKQKVGIGMVRGINGGNLTKSVSCHQSLYPYLLYYCHSVPKVRIYEADIVDVESHVKINDGVAICHIDTSSWAPDHGAFVALGSGPGRIEVCHWIFENDMSWSAAD